MLNFIQTSTALLRRSAAYSRVAQGVQLSGITTAQKWPQIEEHRDDNEE